MLAVEHLEIQNELNKVAIRLQLQKILLDPIFSRSHILQRFLKFIVEETLADRTNCLKEYTIGVKVLDKPTDFNPQSTSIVRIHAVRLRKALENYYVNRGGKDEVRITLPAGHYFPVFMKIDGAKSRTRMKSDGRNESQVSNSHPSLVVAVIPFYLSHEGNQLKPFTDGLGALLSNSLMESGTASVISYFSTRRMAEQYLDIRELAKKVDAKYVFTGDVQLLQGKIRISVQLVRAENACLEWFQAIESKFSSEKAFDLQHQLVQQLMTSVVDKTRALQESETRKAMMAVA